MTVSGGASRSLYGKGRLAQRFDLDPDRHQIRTYVFWNSTFFASQKKSILICIPTLIGPRFKLVHSARVSSFMSCMIS